MRKSDDCLIMEYFTGYMDACDDFGLTFNHGAVARQIAFTLKSEAEEELGKLLDRMHEDYEKDRRESEDIANSA